eukprot:6470093-Amphidinium_carterae.2
MVKGDPEPLRRLLSHYKEKVPPTQGRGRKGTYKFAEFREFEEAYNEKEKDRMGIMMHETRFLKHAQTEEGGGYSYMAAKQKWDAWAADTEHPRDRDGPDHSPLQLYVRTDTIVHDRDVFRRGKRVERSEKVRATDENMARLRRSLVENHEDIDGCQGIKKGKTPELVIPKNTSKHIKKQSSELRVKHLMMKSSGPSFESTTLFAGSIGNLDDEAREQELEKEQELQRSTEAKASGSEPEQH